MKLKSDDSDGPKGFRGPRNVLAILAVCIGVSLNCSAARAEFGVSAVGALNLSSLNGTGGGVSGGSQTGYGGGALLDLGLGSSFSVELGGLYVQRNTAADSTSAIEVPVLLRYHVFRFLSLGAGMYWASQSAAPADLQNYDFGLAGSLALSCPIFQGVALMADGRYLYGLYNVAAIGSSNYRDIQVLAGIRFELGTSSAGMSGRSRVR